MLESAISSDEGTAHTLLLKNHDGPYSRLVSAQRFREKTEEDESDTSSETAGPTQEEVAEMAKTEKPLFETLKRTGTGRSAASEALSDKNRRDLEAGQGKPHTFTYLFMRMVRLNKGAYTQYGYGVVAAIVCGMVSSTNRILYPGLLLTL